jgi:hypothetical protein
MITSEGTNIVLENSLTSLSADDALAQLTLRVRSLLMSDPVGEGEQRQSLMTAAYDITLSLEWIEVRTRHVGYTTEVESELLVLALELSVLEQEWFCGDH